MTDQREAVIQVKGLKKNFGSLEVLKGVDMKVLKGEAVVVIGPSGSGKSTLLRCLNLLETPTGGDIRFRDLNNDGVINDSDRTVIGNPVSRTVYFKKRSEVR